MSDHPDERRVADEIARCHRASLNVTAPAPPLRTVQIRNAKYHAERARILALVDVAAAVTFLREEALAALAGTLNRLPMERWFVLHQLEFGGPPIERLSDMMDQGARKLVREGVADLVAESGREARRGCDSRNGHTCERHG